MDKRYLSFDEAAKFLGLSRPLIERLVAQGNIPSYKIGESRRGRRIFDPEELIEWVKSHRNDKPKKKGGAKRSARKKSQR